MRVLLTGATGYIGSRLVPSLLERGHDVAAAGRDLAKLSELAWAPDVTQVELDVSDVGAIGRAVDGADVVVYLIHSMEGSDFAARDRGAAEAMAKACEQFGVGHVVYLSGLVPDGDLSEHLESRLEVEDIFLESSVPATVLRAAMIVGAGSTSFELMRRMSERVPIVPIPAWMRRSLQPLAVEDVVAVLASAVDGEPRNRHYDVGGDAVLTYRELLALFADVAGLRRPQVVVPLVPQRVVSEIVATVAGIPRGTVKALVESLSHDLVCREDDVRRDLVPGHQFLTMREAFARSLQGESAATSSTGDVQGEATTDDL